MIAVIAAYLRERFKPGIFGPAAAVHAAAALWVTGRSPAVATSALALGLAVALLLQFRLWDDLEDRELDRQRGPARVLTRSDPAPFRRICVLLTIVNLLLIAVARFRAAVLGLGCLDLFFLMAYRQLRPKLPDRIWRFQVLLLKYPVFVGLVAAALAPLRPLRLMSAAAVVYAFACAYEVLHDRQLPLGAIS